VRMLVEHLEEHRAMELALGVTVQEELEQVRSCERPPRDRVAAVLLKVRHNVEQVEHMALLGGHCRSLDGAEGYGTAVERKHLRTLHHMDLGDAVQRAGQ